MGNRRSKRNRAAAKPNRNDRISDLPDAIIHRILSFLPDTKLAAQTSVLSRRWKNLWTSVADLRFNTWYYNSPRSFEKFLLYALLRHRQNYDVRSLDLCIHNDYSRDTDQASSSSDLDEVGLRDWAINYAVRHGLRHVYLRHLYETVEDKFSVPPALLSCRTLKTLDLAHLEVSDLSFTWFPALKSLSLEDCDFDGFLHVTDFNFPELAILRLVDVVGSGDIEVSGANVVRLEMEGVGCDKVKLCAPKLQVFVYSDTGECGFWRLSNLYDVDLPFLREAEVSICGAYEEEGNINIWNKLLLGVLNAESIQLNNGELEHWNKEAALLKLQTPPIKFSSLKVTVVNRNRERRSTGSRKVLEEMKSYVLNGSQLCVDMILRYEDEDGAP